MQSEQEVRQAICEAGRRLARLRIIVATDGNLSARLPGDILLVTPSGQPKDDLSPGDLLKVDLEGNVITGPGRATSELAMHTTVYLERPDVRAVVHGHPPHVVAHMIAGVPLSRCIIPEAVVHLGAPQVASYARPGTEELARSIRPLVRENDCVLMDHHGALTVGEDVLTACFKMEKLEHAAETIWLARLMGRVRELDAAQVSELLALREAAGTPGRINIECTEPCINCGTHCFVRGAPEAPGPP